MRTRFPAGADLAARLAAATRALRAGDGETHVWELPAGEARLPAGTTLGAPGVDLVIEAAGAVLVVDDVPIDPAGPAPAIRLVGERIRLKGGTVRATGAGALVALAVDAEASALDGLRVEGLRGAAVTALAVRGGRTRIVDLDVRDLHADGAAAGLDVAVVGRADVRGARVRALSGDRVSAVRITGAGGEVRDVVVDDLRARDADGLTTLSVAAALAVADARAVRDLRASDPAASLPAAQAALAAGPAGAVETWLLPAGEFDLPAGLTLGAPGRGLRVRGERPDPVVGSPGTLLRVGVGAPVAGDAVGLALAGDDVEIEDLTLSAEATGALTGVRVDAPRLHVSDLTLSGLRGASVAGLEAFAGTGEAGVVDLRVEDAVAAGAVVGARVRAGRAVLADVRVSSLTAGDRAVGLAVVAASALGATSVRAERVEGAAAVGALLRVTEPDAELSALEVAAERVTGTADDATGLALVSAGDLAVRGLVVRTVGGNRATGALLAAAGEIDWVGGDVGDVAAATGGAVGARVLARPSPAKIGVHGVRVGAVSGNSPGAEARPSPTWPDLVRPAAGPDWLRANDEGLPAPAGGAHVEEVAGLSVVVPTGEGDAPAPGGGLPGAVGPVEVTGCVLHRVSGTALQVEAEGRAVVVRGAEAWTAVRGGWVDGDDVLLAQSTWHRVRTGVTLGPARFEVVDVLVTDVEVGLPLVGADRGDRATGAFTGRSDPAAVSGGGAVPFRVAPLELVQAADLDVAPAALYVLPGPPEPLPAAVVAGGRAAEERVDLRLVPGHALHERAVRVPGDDEKAALFVGAWPDVAGACTLRDPLAVPAVAPPVDAGEGPLADYLARDAEGLLALMLERARVVLPDWPADSPADQTRMLLELLANRLDRAAYRQEVAVAEGYLNHARRRRSVEDHARLVDYRPDPGLSATAMLRVDIGAADAAALGLPADGRALTVPRDTIVVNRDPALEAVVFATEADLDVDLRLRSVRLAADVHRGDTAADLVGNLDVARGRWLLLVALDPTLAPEEVVAGDERLHPATPPHVVRVTRVEAQGGTTRVFWDFRRAAPADIDAASACVFGNVVPAHHGMPLTPGVMGWGGLGEALTPWREQLTIEVDNRAGDVREVVLPAGPLSVQATGWPVPGEEASRRGAVRLGVVVDGEEWQVRETLTTSGPRDEHVVERSGPDGGSSLLFGDGTNGAALPRRRLRLDVSLRIGIGARGNVGAGVLTQVLAFGEPGDLPEVLPGHADRAAVAAAIRVTNPLPALGGRDPEDVERIRRRAPLAARSARSAIVPADYERLLAARTDIAGARARFRPSGLRDVVRVTMLLADEDGLTAAGEAGTAERLRRWADVRTRLEDARLLGTDVEVVPPAFVPLDLDVEVDAEVGARADQVRGEVVEALAGPGGLLDPDSTGLGGDVHVDAIYRRVLRVPGVAATRVRRLRRLLAGAPERVAEGVLPIAAEEVAVLRDPLGRDDRDGLLTVTVCGGVA